MIEPELVIRADANTGMGTGHLMRCLALAQGWKDNGGEATLITTCENDNLLDRFRNENIEVIKLKYPYPDPLDWKDTSQILKARPGCWVLLDGYHFDHEYQLLITNADHKLLVIDDLSNLERYSAHIILNQNLYAAQLDYSFDNEPTLLFGPEFALLRREFWKWIDWKRKFPNIAKNVLVTMGGSDPENLTLRVIQILKELNIDGLRINIVLGASNPYADQIKNEINDSDIDFSLKFDVKDLSELMAWADIAITAGGITCYEIAFMRLPSLVIPLAENQKGTAAFLEKSQAAVNLGWYDDLQKTDFLRSINNLISDSKIRKNLSENAFQLVDGKGVKRVIDRMCSSEKRPRYKIRSVKWKDKDLLWRWANDPVVRKNSFNSDQIPMDEHSRWLKGKLDSSKTCFIIIEQDSNPVAQVRYDSISENEAEVSFTVAKEYRGKGIGSAALKLTFEEACKSLQVDRIRGITLESNKASQRVFHKAGYQKIGQELIKKKNSIIYKKSCETEPGEVK